MKFTFITLFPEALKPYLDSSMMRKAQDKGIVEFAYVDLRDYGLGPHKSVDDTPYGGGDGMLLRCEPVFAAIEALKSADPSAEIILPTPAGELWTQKLARKFAEDERCDNSSPDHKLGRAPLSVSKDGLLRRSPPARHFAILCPHYEGYDERILTIIDHKICLGHYVLTGGELPALVIADSIIRLLPGVLGGETSAAIESFSDGDNIEYPQYTKPYDFRGMKVPDILLSGNHGAIAEWRRQHSGGLSHKPDPDRFKLI